MGILSPFNKSINGIKSPFSTNGKYYVVIFKTNSVQRVYASLKKFQPLRLLSTDKNSALCKLNYALQDDFKLTIADNDFNPVVELLHRILVVNEGEAIYCS